MMYTFGPVLSRRFGKSLGIDVSPHKKQCNFDCLYCELKGASIVHHQDIVANVDDIYNEIVQVLSKNQDIDVLTITANGEPTLYPHLNKLVDKLNLIKQNHKLLILSNASTIHKQDIQNILKKIDIVKLSLDSVNQKSFKKLDRTDINVIDIIVGIKEFKKVFDKDLIIEVLFVKGINDSEDDINNLIEVLQDINPTRVDIGTIDRPPAYSVEAISTDRLYEIASKFCGLNVNIASRKTFSLQKKYYSKDEILNTLNLRPLSIDDINSLFDDKAKQNLQELINDDKIFVKSLINIDFFMIRS